MENEKYMPNGSRAWTDEEDSYIRAHYKTDSVKSIAEHLGRTENSVYARVGVLLVTKYGLGLHELRRVRTMAHSDMSVDEIIAELGVPESTLRHFCQKHGIKLPRRIPTRRKKDGKQDH